MPDRRECDLSAAKPIAPTYDLAMRSVTPGQAGSSPTPQRKVPRRTTLVAGVALVALVVLAAMFECDVLRRPADEDAAPGREASSQRAGLPTVQAPTPRPALPQANPVEPAPADPHSLDSITGEDKRTRTHIKVDRYVHEAYPAWLRAHAGQECPRRLSELNEYIHETDANDAWGRPLKMLCGAARWAGKKRIEVISLGRDAEARTEDDIIAEE
jgi:hypothetical protein